MVRAQVLEFQKELNYSVWIDYESRARSVKTIIAELRKCVFSGKYVGYRLIHIYYECKGVGKAPSERDLKTPYIPK